jgi:6-phosphofructokinase
MWRSLLELLPSDDNLFFKATSSNFGVIVVGGTACGINSAVRSFVRHSISKQCRVFAMIDGFDGFRTSAVF